MSDSERSEEKQPLPERVKSPKPTKETWLKARVDYETGNYEGVKELAVKYGLNYDSLRERASREGWKQFDLTVSNRVSQKVAEKVENKVDLFFRSLEEKANRYNKMLLASQEALGSKDVNGTPLLDPDALDTYSKVESRVVDWQKTAYGINDKVQLNASVNVNVLGVLQQVRTMQEKPEVKERVIDVEYLKECSKNLV